MRAAFALALALVPAVATADARHDIVDLRHGRTVSEHEFLGWSPGADAVVRRRVCSEDGELSCTVTIDELGVGKPPRTSILYRNLGELYERADADNPKGPISTAEATGFIRREATVLAGLPPLTPGTAATPPRSVFGAIDGVPTKLAIAMNPTSDDMIFRLSLGVHGPGGAFVKLADLPGEASDVTTRQWQAHVSPDGSDIAIIVEYESSFMCWTGESIEAVAASRGSVRAQLHNAVGLDAYREGELDRARDAFVAATAEDPAYAWGWFNRAALESRSGDPDAAHASLKKAIDLDITKGDRACRDSDFDALAATAAGAALMACTSEAETEH